MAVKKEKVVKPASCTYEELEKLGAKALVVGDQPVGQLIPRKFSTGSYGLSYTGKVAIVLPNGKLAHCQASINLTVIGSKNSEKEKEAA